jgi:hypothetical protein
MAAELREHPLLDPTPIAELRKRNQRRRRRQLRRAGGGALTVALVVGLLVTLLPTTTRYGPRIGPSINVASFVQTSVNVPDSVLEAVGHPATATPLKAVQGRSPLTVGGKPVIVYVGDGACPGCAFQQWALLVALSRFGSFSNLGQFVIPPQSSGPRLPLSWSFAGSTYTSSLLTFEPAEAGPFATTASNGEVLPPETMNPLQQNAIDALEGPTIETQSYPFTDISNRFWDYGFEGEASDAVYTVLQRLSLDQVATDLNNPTSPVAQVIDGAANYLIGDICSIVGAQNAPICSYDTKT